MSYRSIECKNQDALNNYERYITRLLEKANNNLTDLTEAYLTNHINKLSKDFSQKSLNNIKPLFKNFIKWRFLDYPTRFPNLDKLCKTKRASSSYDASQMLSEKEVKKIIETENDLFWKVFWLVFFYGGFRSIDVTRLKWDMISFDKDGMTTIKAFIGKNQKTFYKSIPAEVTPLIKKWKEVNPSEWMFPSTRGDHPIHSKTPNMRLSRISLKALGKKVNPYLLRHSLATIKYNQEGLKDDDVANQLGHSESMKQTYTHLDEKKLIARSKRVWTNKKEMPKKLKDKLEKKIEEQSKDINRQSQEIQHLRELVYESMGFSPDGKPLPKISKAAEKQATIETLKILSSGIPEKNK